MGRIFTVSVDESFFDTLVQHIFFEYEKEKISKIKIILPCRSDVIAMLSAFKNYDSKKCIILPEIVSLENIDEKDLILNLDRIKFIKPTKRILLLIQFILEWNKKNNDYFPIDLAYSLPSLLDKVQCIQITDDYQLNDHSKKMENFINLLVEAWSKTLKNLGVMDILKYKSDYINNMVISLQEDQHIIFVGIGKGEIYKLLIKAIYELPFGKIILPNLNLKIKEKDWKSLDKRHYQYCLKNLLDYLSVSREDISFLPEALPPAHGARICDQRTGMTAEYLDYIFDTTADLSKVSNGYIENIEVITCDSREEESQVMSLIIENEGYENVSLVVFDKLLAARITCSASENYPYVTLLLYSIEVLTSNWNSVALLSLLKHRLVTFGYAQEEYSKILSEFEIEILRSFNTSGLDDIVKVINIHKKLRYKEDILIIINKLETILNPLLNSTNCPISDVVTAHLRCVSILSSVDFLELSNEMGNFTHDFLNACEGVAIECSLELYSQILTLFLRKEFFLAVSDLSKFSLYHNKVVILAGFNDIPSFQSPFLNALTRKRFSLPSVREEQGYFLYNLRNLFCASKVYIINLLSNRKTILLRRLEILLQKSKYPYRDWLRVLNMPEYVTPCIQPMPKPQTKIREEKMQVMPCSAVEKLIRDPYSFYIEYVLNLKQLKDLNFKPSILEFGNMVHSILERYLRNRKSPMSIAQEVFSTSRFNFSNMWWVRLQGIIQSFVEFDKARSNRVELEKSFSYRVPVHNVKATWKLQEVSLTARCDRVEYLPNGQAVIIDYKLGSPPSNEEVMSGFFPQLILQALAVEYTTGKEVSELAYWKLDYDKIKVISLKNYRQKVQEFQSDLPDFLSNYLKNTTPFIASPYFDKFLRFNSYKQLERIGEWL
ncbi:RecB exonuclease [Wolbachia endosymbiont strain TRS of Brugia malayi]|uniref:PD-(D/E)XK nuclease family protein n=1 Tax=Wolbachia endosymbiont of Brugia malayi TaxID=80849 RepID=UPI00004C931E|nr:PD-(D/E)XK nuclease family protein [Wolbachia endosymbiont of Brugia malayi]AAW70861.1 RecB exonuclease [Wolbachia endosymbiont strain TRS of Brugia malayi]